MYSEKGKLSAALPFSAPLELRSGDATKTGVRAEPRTKEIAVVLLLSSLTLTAPPKKVTTFYRPYQQKLK